jgi:hypothetical protein
MTRYSFELRMDQHLGPDGDKARTNVLVDMTGRVEREPFRLDQTIDSDIDGEKSKLRTILTPEAYYMYLPEYEEWSKLSKQVSAENRATLSEFQADPERAIERIRELAPNLEARRNGAEIVVGYEGTGPTAKPFVAGLLRSTLGLTESEGEIEDKLEVEKLSVVYRIDAERDWPLAYRIETKLAIELEPGQKSPIVQTVSGSYGKPNATSPIAVPDEALRAPDPDELGEQLELNE